MKVKNHEVPIIYNMEVNDTGKYSPAKKTKKKEVITMKAKTMSKVRVTVLAGIAVHAR